MQNFSSPKSNLLEYVFFSGTFVKFNSHILFLIIYVRKSIAGFFNWCQLPVKLAMIYNALFLKDLD